MVGVPLEFRSVCEMLRWFQSSDKVNVKTQVVGLAVGRREEIYPENCRLPPPPLALTTHLILPLPAESSLCLWTEWFDQDTPCNSKGDEELHSAHFNSLQQSWTGSSRQSGTLQSSHKDYMKAGMGMETTLMP